MAKAKEKFPEVLYAVWEGEDGERFLNTADGPSLFSESDIEVIAGRYELVGLVRITAPTTVTDVKVH